MKDRFEIITACIIAGLMLAVIRAGYLLTEELKTAQKQLIDCERTLPRGQHCKMIAVPERSAGM